MNTASRLFLAIGLMAPAVAGAAQTAGVSIPPLTGTPTVITGASNLASLPKVTYNSPTNEQIHRVFADELKSGAKLVWYSNPAKVDSSKQTFLSSLADDCHKLGIPVPQIFVLTPKFINGLPDPHFEMGLSESGIDPDFGPYIAIRGDLLDPSKSAAVFTMQHALAVRGHELGHIRNNLIGLHFSSAWEEELAANAVSVALGYGEPLSEALSIEDHIERKAFDAFLSKFYPNETYDQVLSSQISLNPHPPIAIQKACILKLIEEGKNSPRALNDLKSVSPVITASVAHREIQKVSLGVINSGTPTTTLISRGAVTVHLGTRPAQQAQPAQPKQ